MKQWIPIGLLLAVIAYALRRKSGQTGASGQDVSVDGGAFGLPNRTAKDVGGFLGWLAGGGQTSDRSAISPSMLPTANEGWNQYQISTSGPQIVQQDTTGEAARALAEYASRTGADVRVTTPTFTASVIHPKPYFPGAPAFEFLRNYKAP